MYLPYFMLSPIYNAFMYGCNWQYKNGPFEQSNKDWTSISMNGWIAEEKSETKKLQNWYHIWIIIFL